MKTNYCFQTQDFSIAWPERVSRHDLVFQSPPTDPMQYGIPIGNGDIGAMIWCDDRKIYIAVNKSDLWDDAPFDTFENWKESENEQNTTLRHACRIVIDFGIPVFDTFYLQDFSARLRLQDGCAVVDLECPFGKLTAELFLAYNRNILCARVRTDFAEDDGIRITLERYGSRTYAYWYHMIKRDPAIGLSGTDAWVNGNQLLLSHRLTTGDFLCALRPEGEGFRAVRRTNHMVSAQADRCPKEFTFYLTVTSPLDAGSDEARTLSILDQAVKTGFDTLLAENEACWKAFWETSFIETDDDYLDNLWHLAMYYACSGQRGRYPGRFINSLWNWNRDVQPWNFYFHWNQQELYWGLNAAGHHELCNSYLNFRFDGMENARKSARDLFGIENALFVSDVCDRRGINSTLENHNFTPVGEIALDFWRQYRYTCNKTFLKEKALPYMMGACRLFAGRFTKEADGKYHSFFGSTGYEGSDLLYDPITELAMVKALFPATLQAMQEAGVQDPDEAHWRDLLENVQSIPLLDADPHMLHPNEDGTYTIQCGMFRDKTVNCGKVVAVGMVAGKDISDHPSFRGRGARLAHLAGQYIPQYVPAKPTEKSAEQVDTFHLLRSAVHTYNYPDKRAETISCFVSAHPQANVSPVFPIGSISLSDKGSELFDATVSTALTSRDKQIMGWDTMPIALARLGLSDAVDAFIYDFPSIWQYYNNGFGHYGPNSSMVPDMLSPFRRTPVFDSDHKDEPPFLAESFPFRHMGMEPLGVFSQTMSDRLLQSHDGVIRISPAYGKRDARFKLHAVGGFVVMSQIEAGNAAFVAIRSLYGNPLTLANPWKTAWCNGQTYAEPLLKLDTVAGTTYLFTPEPDTAFEFCPEIPDRNESCKVRPDKNAMLGLPRSF